MVATSLSMAPAMLVAQRARVVDLDGPLLLARDREHGLRYEESLRLSGDAGGSGGGDATAALHPRPVSIRSGLVLQTDESQSSLAAWMR